EKVVIAGRLSDNPQEIELDDHAGTIPPDPSPTDAYAVAGLAGVEGQSGAPVASDQGIVGLFNGHAGVEQGFVIPIAAVEAAAPAEVRWMLSEAIEGGHRPIRFCVRQVGPQHPAFTLRNVSLGADNCAVSTPAQ